MALCIVSTVSAEVTIGPRVYYAMAKNRAFFSAAAKVHPRWHTPVVAILSQGLCAMVMTLTSFRDLLLYIGMSLTLFTALSVAALFKFRRTRPGWQRLRAVDFAWPLIPGFVHPGGRGHDGLRRHPAAGGLPGRLRHGGRRRAGLSLRRARAKCAQGLVGPIPPALPGALRASLWARNRAARARCRSAAAGRFSARNPAAFPPTAPATLPSAECRKAR